MVQLNATTGGTYLVPDFRGRERLRRHAEEAHPLFVSNGWTYGLDWRVPTVDELTDLLGDLYDRMASDVRPGLRSVSSGRWTVSRLESGEITVALTDLSADI